MFSNHFKSACQSNLAPCRHFSQPEEAEIVRCFRQVVDPQGHLYLSIRLTKKPYVQINEVFAG